jgi:hypothetical protein
MTIKKLEPRGLQKKKTLPDGTEVLVETFKYVVVLKEISELIEFEQMAKPTKGVYKRRCIVYNDKGDFIAPYSYEELAQIKKEQYTKNNPIGFIKYDTKKTRRAPRGRNLL